MAYYAEEARIFVVGKTGSGKSSTGNSLLGESLFNVGLDFGSVTAQCHVHERRRFGMKMKITDSPGLFDTNKSQEEIASILMKGVTSMHPGPDVILYVTKVGRYTEEEHGSYQRLKALLDDNVTNHMIVVFSHGDLLKGHEISSMLNGAPKELKQVLRECRNRYAVIDNTNANNVSQVQTLFTAISTLKKKNRDRPYACPKYAQVGQKLDEECAKRMDDIARREASRKKYVKGLNEQLKAAEQVKRELEERERGRIELERRQRREGDQQRRQKEQAIRDLELKMAHLQAKVTAKPHYHSAAMPVWHDVGVLRQRSERKAVIKNADMAEDMQQVAVDCTARALEKYKMAKDIAAFIKMEFDKKYNPTWHCIVGENFGSSVTHDKKHYVFFDIGQVAVLLFKCS